MPPLVPGDPLRLGPYRLLGTLGEGGMGKVYLGRDGDRRPAAVKVLRPELAHDHHLAQRFVREAEMARAVTSKGVARVLDAQTEGGRLWIATEFLAGPTLSEALSMCGPLDEPSLRALAHRLAGTLQDIHAAGLVHRDIKPENIVLTSSGPRIIDFGIARPEHGLTLTTTGQTPITPGYGAPEQAMGHRAGWAADVFSLGAVLVYATSGHPAFHGAHAAAVQYEVVHGAPDLSGISPALLELIAPCLAKDPVLRPTAAQIAAAFTPPKGSERAWRKGALAEDIKRREASTARLAGSDAATGSGIPTRRRFLAVAGGVGILAAAGGAGAYWWPRGGAPKPELKNVSASVPPAVETPAAAFASVVDTKQGEPPKALWGPFDVTAPQAGRPLPVRDVVIVHAKNGGLLALGVTNGRERWRAAAVRAQSGYVSVADRLVVAADGAGVLHAFVASTGKPIWSSDIGVTHVLTADAQRVYVVTKDNRLCSIDAWTLATGWTRPVESTGTSRSPVTAAVSANRLVVHERNGHVVCLDTSSGETTWDVKDQGKNGAVPAIAGKRVYLGGDSLSARDLESGDVEWSEASENLDTVGLRWGSPAAENDMVFALDGATAYGYRTHAEISSAPEPTLQRILEGVGATTVPPVIEGTTVWFPAPDSSYVQVFHKKTAAPLFMVRMQRTGGHRFAGGGNRVFISRGGRVGALPVYEK
ncbi:serine/threonine-protein kinase [Streptomyces sp. NPDC002992]|uniref:serine/threonine-protein kinase n=1 Tax=Streptomyces sp. NPDC002992 TaxID=3154273 RepID=UPI0033B04E33